MNTGNEFTHYKHQRARGLRATEDAIEVLGDTTASLVKQLRLVWAIIIVLAALTSLSLLGHCIGSAHARPEVPPAIAPLLPDGGMCEQPPPRPPDELWSLLEDPATEAERIRVEVVLNGCPKAPREAIDPWRVLALLRLEAALGVPAESSLLLPAILCVESAFVPARDLYGDAGKARGPMQLHWAWAAFCMDGRTMRSVRDWRDVMEHGDFRGSLAFSARCWIAAIERQLPKAIACGERAFDVAEAIVSWAPHPLDCNARTSHAKLAEQWRRAL